MFLTSRWKQEIRVPIRDCHQEDNRKILIRKHCKSFHPASRRSNIWIVQLTSKWSCTGRRCGKDSLWWTSHQPESQSVLWDKRWEQRRQKRSKSEVWWEQLWSERVSDIRSVWHDSPLSLSPHSFLLWIRCNPCTRQVDRTLGSGRTGCTRRIRLVRDAFE